MFPKFPGNPMDSWAPYIIGIVVGIIIIIRTYMGGPQCPSKEKLRGKVAVVTGANSGIGYEIALALAARGAKVILACRDLSSGKNAIEKMKQMYTNLKVEVQQIDLSSLNAVQEFARNFKEPRLHILVNNAGVMLCPFSKTSEGFEQHFVTNYLGHFLLTHLLLPKLQSAAEFSETDQEGERVLIECGRVINISARAHFLSTIYVEDLNMESNYVAREAFGQSKLALTLMAREMSKKIKDNSVTFNSVHPGFARGTNILRHTVIETNKLLKLSLLPIMFLLMKSPREAAQTPLYLAIAPELMGISGKYFSDCQEQIPADAAQDDDLSNYLYRVSCHLVDIEPLE